MAENIGITESTLDAGEILTHLNEMGYRNITAEQLKEFMKDLKKLIKYEARHCDGNTEHEYYCSKPPNRFEILHQTHTVCSSAKLSAKGNDKKILKQQNEKPVSRPSSASPKSKMWIRPRAEVRKIRKSDPVALYNNYQRDWDKFKNFIPGQNKHLDLRWAIREKLHRDRDNS